MNPNTIADLREKASIPSQLPQVDALPPSTTVALSTHSSDSNLPDLDANDLHRSTSEKPKQAGAFALARTTSEKIKGKHLEDGLGDEDSSLNALGERTLSWQKAAVLLIGEYIGFALLAFPFSYQHLGMAGGLITTFLVGIGTLYTSHVLWRLCMAYPQCRDIADCCYYLFGQKRWAWTIGFIGMALNNVFIMGLHINISQSAINTLGYKVCSAVMGLVACGIMFAGSLLRDLNHTTPLGVISAGSMVICVFIVIIGHAVQGNPNGFVNEIETPLTWTVWAPEGTTYVQGMAAFLNIAYSFIGQALVPTWVGDMAKPEDFPKALYVQMAVEVVLMVLTGSIVYSYSGTTLTEAPAYGSLIAKYGRPAAIFVLPPALIVGVLYSLVTSRAVFYQLFDEKSIHRTSHTKKGWFLWTAIVAFGWVIAYIIGQAVPFFSDLLSLISSLFGSWFGFTLWSIAYYHLYRNQGFFTTKLRSLESIWNVLMAITGLYMFGAGTYASVQSIMISYTTGDITAPFTCENTGFSFDR